MKSLTDIWKKVQHGMAASTWFDMPAPVQKEMEKLGWTFHTVAGGSPMGIHYNHYIYTPEGKMVNGGERPEDFKRYADTRRQIADRLYPVP